MGSPPQTVLAHTPHTMALHLLLVLFLLCLHSSSSLPVPIDSSPDFVLHSKEQSLLSLEETDTQPKVRNKRFVDIGTLLRIGVLPTVFLPTNIIGLQVTL